jgi:hypothetical protein
MSMARHSTMCSRDAPPSSYNSFYHLFPTRAYSSRMQSNNGNKWEKSRCHTCYRSMVNSRLGSYITSYMEAEIDTWVTSEQGG